MVELLVLGGSRSGACFQLPDVPTIVGRSPEAHLRIDDPWISNLHALFELRGQELWVVDLGSRNGTFVDGARVGEARVGVGSLLAFGRTEARLEAPGAAGGAGEMAVTPVHYEAISMTTRTSQPNTDPGTRKDDDEVE